MRQFFIWALTLASLLLAAPEAWTLDYYWGKHPDKERLVFEFNQKIPAAYTIKRTGPERLTLTLPAEVMQQIFEPAGIDTSYADILGPVSLQDNHIHVQTRTPSFGYIHFELQNQNKLVLDLFPDEFGELWPPPAKEQPPELVQSEDEPYKFREMKFTPLETQQETPDTAADQAPDQNHYYRSPVRLTGPEEPEEPDITDDPEEPDVTDDSDESQEPQTDSELEHTLPDMPFEPIPTEMSDEEYWENLLFQGRAALGNREHDRAREILNHLLDQDPDQEFQGQALYLLAENIFQEKREQKEEHFAQIHRAFRRVMSHDPYGQHAPDALLRLLILNLNAGNEPEAKAYFNLLQERFPEHENLPTAHIYLGNHYQDNERYEQAAAHYQTIVEDFPQSNEIRSAAMGLAQTLRALEFYEQALEMVNYLENRWPRLYLDNPEFLNQAGLIALENDQPQRAKDFFLHFYNLFPDTDMAHLVLARIGDSYLRLGQEQEAQQIYLKTIEDFPEQEGGLVAKMRLAEEGLIEDHSPGEIYNRILEEYPDNPLAPLAKHNLARWQLAEQRPQKALETVRDFEDRFPDSDLRPRSRALGRRALGKLLDLAAQNEFYERAVHLWEQHSFLFDQPADASPEIRLSAALSLWKTNAAQEALQLAEDMLYEEDLKAMNYRQGLELLLNIYLDNQNWTAILDLEEHARDRDLPSQLESRLKYAQALALENLDRQEQSLALWEDLAVDPELPNLQQGYAYYFLAQNELDQQNWENVYNYAQSALSTFLEQDPRVKERALDCLDMLIEITRRSGRIMEAIQWAQEYQNLIDSDSDKWPAIRYRLAELHEQAGNEERWRQTLIELQAEHGNTRYGRLAASDLDGQDLEQRARDLLQ